MYKQIALTTIALALLAGCTSDQVVGRYASALCATAGASADNPGPACETKIPSAEAFAVSFKTSGPSPANGTSFPERALAAYIWALAGMKNNSATLRDNLAKPITSVTQSGVEDRTVFHRTLIVSVRKDGDFNPADRLESTDVTIRLTDARFDSWDTIATAYTTLNAGTVQFTQARGVTESLGLAKPTAAPLTATASIAGSQTDTRVENYTATVQVETVSATVEENGKLLRIHRQGGVGIDLTGNTVIKVDIAYIPSPQLSFVLSVAKFVDDNGDAIAPSTLDVSTKALWGPTPGSDIHATVGLHYIVRHIVKGGSTYEEKDDDVVEYVGDGKANMAVLIPAREAVPGLFSLHQTASATLHRNFLMSFRRGSRSPALACFTSYPEALDFVAYLEDHIGGLPVKVGKLKLGYGDATSWFDLPVADIKTLKVEPGC